MPKRDDRKLSHGHRKRLRARFARAGIEGLNDYEALELLLSYAIPRRDTKSIAKRLLVEFGSLHEVLNAPAERLARVKGVGERSALLIRLVRDFQRESLCGAGASRILVDSTRKAVDYFRSEFATVAEEQFGALLLDAKARLLRFMLLSKGTIDRAAVYPRQLAEAAIQCGATGVILGHNHPRKPSEASEIDRAMTRQLLLAFTPIGVDILDHIILGDDGAYSFARSGELDVMRDDYEATIKRKV
jgi:DNA repair protein RadC